MQSVEREKRLFNDKKRSCNLKRSKVVLSAGKRKDFKQL